MDELLELAIGLDVGARDLYGIFSESAEDPELRRVFGQLSRDEAHHVEWWSNLRSQWQAGLIAALPDPDGSLLAQMRTVLAEVRETVPHDAILLSDDAMLTVAAKLEFFALDPVFGDMLDAGGPATSAAHRAAYEIHIERLVKAIEAHSGPDALSAFLARVLRSTWRTNQELTRFANRDALTDLPNRRAFLSQMEPWVAWAARYGHPFGVLMIDVDRFKSVNDTAGHATGDRALRAIAEALRGALRASDTVARYGGDEFIALLPEADAAQAALLEERLVAAVRACTVIDEDGGAVPLSVSVGGAVVDDPAGAPPRAIDEILIEADRSLYLAKGRGRDCCAEPLTLSAT
jgi:diguanylate cyclase (GGDEF)-like protein